LPEKYELSSPAEAGEDKRTYITLRRLSIDICARRISRSSLNRSISAWSYGTGNGRRRRASSFSTLKLNKRFAARLAGRAFKSRVNMTFPFAASGFQGASIKE